MVSLDKIRADMKERLAVDQLINSVEVNANTIDEALADAAVQLDTKTLNLQYDILEKGSDGFLGFGRKPWKLRIYQNPETLKQQKMASGELVFATAESEEEIVVRDKDGLFYVRHFSTQIMLKVILPVGKGENVNVKDIIAETQRQDTISIDENSIKKYAKQGTDGKYLPIGEYKHVMVGDCIVAVDASKDEMKATITVTPPSMSGAEVSEETIMRALKSQGIVAGFDEKRIAEFVDNPVYNIPYEVCSAVMPVDGKDAYVQYNFETDIKKLRAKESDNGNVNFKELNQIQNVVSGQALAKKIPPEKGKGGKTIFGRYLEAKNGRDITVTPGENVVFDRDGMTMLAAVDGEVSLVNGKVTVEPVKYLDAVNIKTGNITFLGSVVVKNSVEDGYDVKASGNVEINGTVGRCQIEAGGNVIVRQGVFGREEGSIKSGKSIWAKFIQATHVECEGNVIVSDSIMNSEVTAMKNIILRGKKAQITGGHLFATEEICARNIGSPGGGTETVLEVGVDPRAKKRLMDLQDRHGEIVKELENIELDVQNIEQRKKIQKKLAQDKEQKYQNLKKRHQDLCLEAAEITQEIEKINEHMRELKAIGKVKCEGNVYAGVKISVRDILDEVKADTKNITFYYERGFVKRGKYEPPSITEEEMYGDTAD